MKSIKFLLSLAVLLCLGFSAKAENGDAPVKREMRSAWVATVWRLDWPSVTIGNTGNQSQIDRQKKDMTTLLDSLQINNFNAINFQIRSRCDAMYKSSYEPWSSDLVTNRGTDPGWDPLEWVVEECHKRGIECHAWVNPYRYESVTGQWTGDNEYRKTHPDWIMDYNNASILNPGKQEVIDQIVRVIREVVQNYDVDGVLFDDYFYLSGTPMSLDADLYQAYTKAGGKLSQADWRRDNVNRMVKSVYDMIQEEKPWVRFGVSPAGIACTSASVAKKYGISPCPTGSDWQYNSIYSDPIAWLNDKSIDFISPQIYWTIGNYTDYDAAAKWWSEVANKFGRHFYSSHSISSLTASSTASGKSNAEQNIELAQEMNPLASGPNDADFTEYSNEVRLNRKYTLNDAPGSIFYSCKYIYSVAPKFGHHLRKYVFNTPSLVPAMTHKGGYNPGQIKNLSIMGTQLSWEGYDNVRYTIYAVPTSVPLANFDKEAEYLVGVSYDTKYTLPSKFGLGYNIGVCVLDRFGNEYSPIFLGQSAEQLAAPDLVYPADGEELEAPFDFKWTAVENALGYSFELSDKADFSNVISTQIVFTNSMSTSNIDNLPLQQNLYWRVRSMANSYVDGVSGIRSFKASQLLVTSPANEQQDVAIDPVITWAPVKDVEIEIYSDDMLDKKVYSAEANGGSHKVPAGYLAGAHTYYLRLVYTLNGELCNTPVVSFTTAELEKVVPSVTYPENGGTFHSEQDITLSEMHGHVKIQLEVAASSSFPSRSRFMQPLTDGTFTYKAGDVKISNKLLAVGTKYYIRAKAFYNTNDGVMVETAYSPVVEATYTESSGVDEIIGDGAVAISGNILYVGDNPARVEIYNVSGALVNAADGVTGEYSLESLPAGVYVIRVAGKSMKYIGR